MILRNGGALVVLLCLVGVPATAKRRAPTDASLVVGDMRYAAPHFSRTLYCTEGNGGILEASRTTGAALLWWVELYRVVPIAGLEGDVQDRFVTSISQQTDGLLLIEAEGGGRFTLDVKSREVKELSPVQGAKTTGRSGTSRPRCPPAETPAAPDAPTKPDKPSGSDKPRGSTESRDAAPTRTCMGLF